MLMSIIVQTAWELKNENVSFQQNLPITGFFIELLSKIQIVNMHTYRATLEKGSKKWNKQNDIDRCIRVPIRSKQYLLFICQTSQINIITVSHTNRPNIRQNVERKTVKFRILCNLKFYIFTFWLQFCLFMSNLRANVPRNKITQIRRKKFRTKYTIFEIFSSPNRICYANWFVIQSQKWNCM